MKRASLLMLLALGTIVGCNKDNDPSSVRNPGDPDCFLLTQKNEGGTEYIYTYDHGRVTSLSLQSIGRSNVLTFEYDGDKVVRVAGSTVSENSVRSELTYSGDLVVKQEWFNDSGDITDRQEYEYSGNQMTSVHTYEDAGAGLKKIGSRTFAYSDNSLSPTNIKYFAGNQAEPYLEGVFTYGDKFSALGGVPADFFAYHRLNWLSPDKNVVKVSYDNGEIRIYTYEFNENGFPTKRSEQTNASTIVTVQNNTFDCK